MLRLTKKELELVNNMCSIASAAEWGEGDYQSWDESTTQTFETLRQKIWDALGYGTPGK